MRDGKAAHYAVRLVDAFEETVGRADATSRRTSSSRTARDLQQMLDEERETHRRTKVAPTARSRGVGAARDVGQGAHGRHRRAARVEDRARRSQAGQRLPDQGSVASAPATS